MLELVREFAAELLAGADDVAVLRSRHARYYTDWADDASERMLVWTSAGRSRAASCTSGTWTGDHQRDAVGYGNRVYIATRRGELDEAVELARKGRVEDAAMLVASAEATAQRLGLREVAGDVSENEQIRALIAGRAGDDLARWRARGRVIPLDEALRVALGPRPAIVTGARLTRSLN